MSLHNKVVVPVGDPHRQYSNIICFAFSKAEIFEILIYLSLLFNIYHQSFNRAHWSIRSPTLIQVLTLRLTQVRKRDRGLNYNMRVAVAPYFIFIFNNYFSLFYIEGCFYMSFLWFLKSCFCYWLGKCVGWRFRLWVIIGKGFDYL